MIVDPLTKEQFEPKRITQRFSKPENRIKFHNEKAKILRRYEAVIDKPLKRTHRILLELLPPGKEKKECIYHKEFLLGKGISFGVFTQMKEHDGKSFSAIYNYIFIALDKEQIKIIIK